MSKSPQTKPRKVKTSDGTIMYVWDRKLHSWDGPALIPQGDNKKSQYFVNGMEYTKDQWLEAKKEQSGLPWYKSSIGKQDGNRY
jgi:hypothetical protein